MQRLFDMHCHLSAMANADEVALDAAGLGISLLNTSVSPADARAAERFAIHGNVRLARGLHPWWIADGKIGPDEILLAADECAASRFVGEVGLDFSGARAKSAEAQAGALETIVRACEANAVEGRVVSIHAVRSAEAVLDILEAHGMAGGAACIMHWFSGTSDELVRARELGCYFSVNERMLASRRGREYARQAPLERLLLETDAPRTFGQRSSGSAIRNSLECALDSLADIRLESRDHIAGKIMKTSEQLIGD